MSIERHPAILENPILDLEHLDRLQLRHHDNETLTNMMRQSMPDRDYVTISAVSLELLARGLSPQRLVEELIAAGAPYVHVPRHLFYNDYRPLKISNDHSLLGIRAALRLAEYLPDDMKLLPLFQSIWYFPKGIDICGQATLPGFYGGYGDTLHALRTVIGFMGLKRYPQRDDWRLFPKAECRFSCTAKAIRAGTVEERLKDFNQAIFYMEPERALRLFLGLIDEPGLLPRLRSDLLFLALTDQQERVLGGSLNTQQHPTVRVRDLFDLGDYLKWRRPDRLASTVVPDLALGPRHYELHDLIGTLCSKRFGTRQESIEFANTKTLSPAEREAFMRIMLDGSYWDVLECVAELLTNGFSLSSIMEAILLASSRVILMAELHGLNPFESLHVFDYLNTLSTWIHECKHPRKLFAPFFGALSVHHSIPREESKKFLHHFGDESSLPAAQKGTPEDIKAALLAHDSKTTVAFARTSLTEPTDKLKFTTALAEHFARAQDNPHHTQLAVAVLEESKRVSPQVQDEFHLMLASYAAGIRSESTAYEVYLQFCHRVAKESSGPIDPRRSAHKKRYQTRKPPTQHPPTPVIAHNNG